MPSSAASAVPRDREALTVALLFVAAARDRFPVPALTIFSVAHLFRSTVRTGARIIRENQRMRQVGQAEILAASTSVWSRYKAPQSAAELQTEQNCGDQSSSFSRSPTL